jgi:hypothetical protein
MITLNDDFSNIQDFETEITKRGFIALWRDFIDQSSNGFDYSELNNWQSLFSTYGLTFNFGLDSVPIDFVLQ